MNQRLYNYFCWLLSRREYSTQKLVEKGISKKYPRPEIQEVIEILKSKGFLDDQRYANIIIRNLLVHKSKGINYIRAKLSQEGIQIESQDIEKIISEHSINLDDQIQKSIIKILKAKGMTTQTLDRLQKNKILQKLMRQGFTLAEAHKSLNNLIQINLEKNLD